LTIPGQISRRSGQIVAFFVTHFYEHNQKTAAAFSGISFAGNFIQFFVKSDLMPSS